MLYLRLPHKSLLHDLFQRSESCQDEHNYSLSEGTMKSLDKTMDEKKVYWGSNYQGYIGMVQREENGEKADFM